MMDNTLLPKGFFKNNPLEEMSAARIMDFSSIAEMNDEIHDEMTKALFQTLPPERIEKIQAEEDLIDGLGSAEEIVAYMRKISEPCNRPALCKRALAVQAEVMPLILRRFLTSSQDVFIDTAARIFICAERIYAEQLLQSYREIRDAYAQSAACLVFGEHKLGTAVPLLLREYKRFQNSYPDETFAQGPLLALYIIYGKA